MKELTVTLVSKTNGEQAFPYSQAWKMIRMQNGSWAVKYWAEAKVYFGMTWDEYMAECVNKLGVENSGVLYPKWEKTDMV